MLDRDGFRPNVGIVLLNARNQVFWGKRLRTHSWQFPQGGIKHGESPEQAMYRELHEEVGLRVEHVQILARTRDWLRYEVPEQYIRRDARGHYKGQKQIWFLLRLVGRDTDMNLRATDHPEFDAWRWNDYWVPHATCRAPITTTATCGPVCAHSGKRLAVTTNSCNRTTRDWRETERAGALATPARGSCGGSVPVRWRNPAAPRSATMACAPPAAPRPRSSWPGHGRSPRRRGRAPR